DSATGAEVHRFTRPGSKLRALAFSPDGATIAVAGQAPVDGTADHNEVLLLNASDLTLRVAHPTADEPHNNVPNQTANANEPEEVAFSPDGRTLAVPMTGGRIGLWNLAAPGTAWKTLRGHDDLAQAAAFS